MPPSIRQCWKMMGMHAYPDATELLISADAGKSTGYRSRAWKVDLQEFADDAGLRIRASHFPPGTSKWSKLEHRLFCHITQNWRGQMLRTSETIPGPERQYQVLVAVRDAPGRRRDEPRHQRIQVGEDWNIGAAWCEPTGHWALARSSRASPEGKGRQLPRPSAGVKLGWGSPWRRHGAEATEGSRSAVPPPRRAARGGARARAETTRSRPPGRGEGRLRRMCLAEKVALLEGDVARVSGNRGAHLEARAIAA
jgi:hypothetical protein